MFVAQPSQVVALESDFQAALGRMTALTVKVNALRLKPARASGPPTRAASRMCLRGAQSRSAGVTPIVLMSAVDVLFSLLVITVDSPTRSRRALAGSSTDRSAGTPRTASRSGAPPAGEVVG